MGLALSLLVSAPGSEGRAWCKQVRLSLTLDVYVLFILLLLADEWCRYRRRLRF
jgi:hypothetical protein